MRQTLLAEVRRALPGVPQREFTALKSRGLDRLLTANRHGWTISKVNSVWCFSRHPRACPSIQVNDAGLTAITETDLK
jgi:hypothetical protein